MNIYNWTRNRSVKTNFFEPINLLDLKKLVSSKNNFLPFGNGRSYGDVCLNNKNLISMRKINKILFFDKKKGIIEVESGILVSELLPEIIKSNYFLPVTAGTKFITVGGMVANNIHGKNVKNNYFSHYIISLEIVNSDGKHLTCSKHKNKKLFYSTIGGIGLTGVIYKVRFKLKKISSLELQKKNIFFNKLNNINVFDKISQNYDYSVTWLSSFSRSNNIKGIHFLTKHINTKQFNNKYNIKKRKINFLQKFIFYLFSNYYLYRFINLGFFLYHFLNLNKKVTLENFFYVQDKYVDWNKVYGEKGFFEIHILVPKNNALNFLKLFFQFCYDNKIFSNLIVLKRLKEKKRGINFMDDGVAISCDFKINKNYKKITNFYLKNAKKYGYIFYFAKDGIISNKNYTFDKEFYKFKSELKKFNKENKIKSYLSNRVGLTK